MTCTHLPYLYGLGVIGSQTDAWSYLLPDGLTSSRQLADANGAITQATAYTPWGDTLAVNGANLAYGYLGGIMDVATGLIYVGNGQYYDPTTGRFLTRGVNPDQTNPYVPWQGDPTSLLISPLALLALVYTGKRKRSKLDVFVALIVVCGVLSLSLAGCGPSTPGDGTPYPPIETPFGYTDTPTPGTVNPSTPTPGGTPIGTPTYTCTPSPTVIDSCANALTPIILADDLINSLAEYAVHENNISSSVPEKAIVASRIKLLLGAANEYVGLQITELAYILASAHWESHYGGPNDIMMWEDLSEYPNRYEYLESLGNIYEGDGRTFRGRGFIHITGRNAYTEMQRVFGVNLTQYRDDDTGPELVATDFELSAEISVYGMVNGTFSTRKLSDYIIPPCDYDFIGARAIVNGNDNAEVIAEIAQGYWQILESYAVGE